jgi:predicted nucleotidyltransferase
MKLYTIPQIKDMLRATCSDDRINRIILFGSYAKDQASDKSDIDLYLDSDGRITGFEFFDLKAAIEEAFNNEIDLLPDVDITVGSSIYNEINTYGVVVYGN